jgi:dipeptidyl aminopeptidase/acylaminoacyl peptidase
VPTQLVIYPRELHGIREYAHQVDLLRRVRSWYDRWLRA